MKLLINDAEGRSYHEPITLGSAVVRGFVKSPLIWRLKAAKSRIKNQMMLPKLNHHQKRALKGSTKWLKYNLKRKYLATKRGDYF